MKKPKIKAYYNHGRWVADCPNCNSAEQVNDSTVFICSEEYPYVSYAGKSKADVDPHRVMLIHEGKQSLAKAKQDNEIYDIVFPEFRSEIERVLSARPPVNRNWLIGETIDDLVEQNRAHGITVEAVS